MGRSWEKWCVDKGFDEGRRLDMLSFLYFWWDTLNSIWRETDEASKVSRRLRGKRLTAYANPRTLLDSASFINYVSRYQSDVCLYNGINTARPWSQPGLPILHLLGIYQQQELTAMGTNNVLSFAWYPLKSIFDELSGMDTQDIDEMSSNNELVFADRLQAALDNWVTKKRGLANIVGKPVPIDEEANVTDGWPCSL